MIWQGYPKKGDPEAVPPDLEGDNPDYDTFRIVPLRFHLFDPERLPIHNGLLITDLGQEQKTSVG